jgi:hypothetical protein
MKKTAYFEKFHQLQDRTELLGDQSVIIDTQRLKQRGRQQKQEELAQII